MAGIWLNPMEIQGLVGDVVGYRAGLVLTLPELTKVLATDSKLTELWRVSAKRAVRVRPDEIEALVRTTLARVGYLPDSNGTFPTIDLQRAHAGDATQLANVRVVLDRYYEDIKRDALQAAASGVPPGPWDATMFLHDVRKDHGPAVTLIAVDFVRRLQRHLLESPWSMHRDVEWVSLRRLAELRDSPMLESEHGRFLDQRFVDYLAAQTEALDTMHWRKFEGLTAEYFHRLGLHVEIGPGGNDGGVDVRVWDNRLGKGSPLYLVQCKRQKDKVGKVVVKALWSDVVDEGATEGIIVTTSALEPGAENVIVARRYPISTADRTVVQRWLSEMRTPGRGVFLAR
jgi:restriction system protein